MTSNDQDLDLNLVVLAGRLAAPPEVRQFESGQSLIRYLVTTRTETPTRRVDVVPVTLHDPRPDQSEDAASLTPGDRVWVAGSAQRRFWSQQDGRRSQLEVVAEQVCIREQGATA